MAFRPRIRVNASSNRSAVISPLSTAARTKPKSSSWLRKNKIMSQPAVMACTICRSRGSAEVSPTISEASVKITPLKPRSSRSRSVNNSGATVAGRMSASAIPGRSFREYSGSMMCPTMIDSIPAPIPHSQILR